MPEVYRDALNPIFFTTFPILTIDNGFPAVDISLNLLPELYPESGALAHF